MTAVLAGLSVAALLVLRKRRRRLSSQLEAKNTPHPSSSLDDASPRSGHLDAISSKQSSSRSPSSRGRISAFSFPSQLGRQETKDSNEDPLISVEDAELGSAEPFEWQLAASSSHTVVVSPEYISIAEVDKLIAFFS